MRVQLRPGEIAWNLITPAGTLGNLTSNFARQFNEHTPDVKHISYFCYGGAGMNSFLLKPVAAIRRIVDYATNV